MKSSSINITEIVKALKTFEDPRYFYKDSEILEEFGLSRTYLRVIRKQYGIKKHKERIVDFLATINTSSLYVQDLVDLVGGRVDYMCFYKIIDSEGIPILKKGKND